MTIIKDCIFTCQIWHLFNEPAISTHILAPEVGCDQIGQMSSTEHCKYLLFSLKDVFLNIH